MHSTVTVMFSLFPMRLIYPFGEDLEAAIKAKLLVTTRGPFLSITKRNS